MTEEEQKKISLRIPAKLWEALEKEAEKTERSVSAVIRVAIKKYLGRK